MSSPSNPLSPSEALHFSGDFYYETDSAEDLESQLNPQNEISREINSGRSKRRASYFMLPLEISLAKGVKCMVFRKGDFIYSSCMGETFCLGLRDNPHEVMKNWKQYKARFRGVPDEDTEL